MATYRLVARHVRFWRGINHHWSTVYHYTGSTVLWSATFLQTLAAQDRKMLYGTAQTGGLYQVEVYDQAAGGPPLLTLNIFDPSAQGNWPGFAESVWAGTGLSFNPVAEVALQVQWATGGTSKSGKAVYLRKWYHSVPNSASINGGQADVSAANVTALTTAAQGFVGLFSAQGLTLSGPSGNVGTVASVRSDYGNHQMPRGRRRPALVSASGQYKGPAVRIPTPPVSVD